MPDIYRLDLTTARPKWTMEADASPLSAEVNTDRSSRPVLIVLGGLMSLDEVSERFEMTRSGSAFIERLSHDQVEVLGAEGPLGDELADALRTAVGQDAGPVDVLAIDGAGPAIPDGLSRMVRHVVAVGGHTPMIAPPWSRASWVGAGQNQSPGTLAQHLVVPTDASVAELLSMEQIARALDRWLGARAQPIESVLPAWREKRFILLDEYSTITSAQVVLDLDPPTWIVYQWRGPDSESVKYHAFLPTELRSLLRGAGSGSDHLGLVLAPDSHDEVGIDDAPVMTIGDEAERLLIVDGSHVLAIVPHVDDVLAPARAPRRVLGHTTRQPAATGEEPPVRQFIHVRGPEAVGVGVQAELEVQISGADLGSQSGELASVAGFASAAGPLNIHVVGSAALRVVKFDQRFVKVQAPGRSESLGVVLEGIRRGRGSLQVSLLQGSEVVARVSLAMLVTDNTVHHRGQVASGAGSLRPEPCRRSLLNVHDSGNGQLSYLLVMSDGRRLQDSLSGSSAEVVARVGLILAEVDRMAAARSDGQIALDTALRGIGIGLLESFIPAPMRLALWEEREVSEGLEITSNLPLVPWELVYVGRPAGQIVRSTSEDGYYLGHRNLTRSLPSAPRPTPELRLGSSRAVVVEPRYTTVPTMDPLTPVSQRLMRMLNAIAPEATTDVVTAILAEGEFDLFHFNGHGDASTTGIDQCLILDDSLIHDDRWIRVLRSDVVRGVGPWPKRPLVFLNGCQTGIRGTLRPGQEGFVELFMRHGASAFIGAQWRVTDASAAAFAEAFYNSLIKGEASLAEATTAARTATAEEWSATPLAYAVYGHPEARVVRHGER